MVNLLYHISVGFSLFLLVHIILAHTSDKATVGKIYDVYKAWCQDNNSGYAKSAKEFRNIISEYLNTSYSNLTVRSKAGIIYRNYTLSVDTKQQYCRIYGFDDVLW